LDIEVIKYVHAESGVYCIMHWAVEKPCRSANYNKTASSGRQTNCELIQTVDREEYTKNLKKNENIDHYIILSLKRVSI
jgi:predicted Co/Zn/Cd cation transporter (cation efflux family)